MPHQIPAGQTQADQHAPRHASNTPLPIVQLRGVTKIYGSDDATRVIALNNVDLDIFEGQFTSIMGPSGSGKSTLLHALAGLDSVTHGVISVAGQEITSLSDKDLTHFRRDNIGFVFQSFNLVPTIDAEANIKLPTRLANQKVDEKWMDQIVTALQLKERLGHKPHELSGGQQQRVAVARALVSRPAVLVADEPTGNLDSSSSSEVLTLLRDAVDQLGQTVIMVTHDIEAAAIADRTLIVRDGRIVDDLYKPSIDKIAEVTR
jgi:putative ABC transport system ATP-binding protein